MYLSIAQQLIQGVKLIGLEVIDVLDTGIDEHFQAMNAGRMGNIDSRVLYARSILGCLRDGIHLCVNGSKAVFFGIPVGCFGLIDKAADVGAVGHACRRSVVTGREDILIPNDDRPNLGTGTCGTFRDLLRYGHEVLIPA